MAQEAWVQSQVESYQRLLKWYLIPSCLTLSTIRYGSRVKWRNPGKGVAPFLTPWCSSYRKGRLRVILDYGRQLLLFISFYIYSAVGSFYVYHSSMGLLTSVRGTFSWRFCKWYSSGLITLFNGISTFVGYLKLKPSL